MTDPTDHDDDLTRRLGAYIDDLAAEPMPDDLSRLTGGQVRATAGAPRARWSENRRWLAVAAGVLVVAVLSAALVRRGVDDDVRIDSAGTPAQDSALSTVSPSSSAVTPSAPSSVQPNPPPTTVAALGPVVLADDFADDPVGSVPSGWTVGSGQWRVAVDGPTHYAKTTTPAPSEGRLSTGSPTWTDYTVSAQVVAGGGTTVIGLGARYQGPGDHLFCKVDARRRLVEMGIVEGGAPRVLDSQPYAVPTGRQPIRLRFAVQGNALTCGVDGGPTLRATDGTFAAGAIAVLGADDGAATSVVVTLV